MGCVCVCVCATCCTYRNKVTPDMRATAVVAATCRGDCTVIVLFCEGSGGGGGGAEPCPMKLPNPIPRNMPTFACSWIPAEIA